MRSKHNRRFYAIKVLSKEKIVRTKQVSHTRNEQAMLQSVQHPFIVNLWGTFQDASNLYMVMDFVPGGELFTLLRRSNVSVSRCMLRVDSCVRVRMWSRPCPMSMLMSMSSAPANTARRPRPRASWVVGRVGAEMGRAWHCLVFNGFCSKRR